MSYPTAAVFDNVTYPTLANGTLSQMFSVPQGALSCIVFPPNSAGAWAVQAVPPPDSDKVALASQALSFACQPATDGASVEATMTGFTANTAMAFDCSMFGGGILQFSGGSAVATPDSVTFKVVWNIGK